MQKRISLRFFSSLLLLIACTSALAETGEEGTVRLNPGRWGNLEYLPITISAPEELLKVRGIETAPVTWFFRGYSRQDLGRLLESLDVTSGERNKFLDPQILKVSPTGLSLVPPREAVMNLSPKAVEGVYKVLGLAKQNEEFKWQFLTKNFDTYRSLDVSEETLSLLKHLSYQYGKFTICYCMSYVLSGIPLYEEKVRLAQALTQQQTMLLKLRVTPASDIQALASYWGKAFWTTDVKSILGSIKRLPGGGVIDVIELLPPLPTSQLYNYPIPPNALNPAPVIKNCTWTAFNFFRDPPDSGYSNPAYVVEKLKTDFYAVQSDPQYGDIAVFLTPSSQLVHAAVYVADDIVYTKNGDNLWHPWVFSTISDLKESFSFSVAPGQSLQVFYFRNKYY